MLRSKKKNTKTENEDADDHYTSLEGGEMSEVAQACGGCCCFLFICIIIVIVN